LYPSSHVGSQSSPWKQIQQGKEQRSQPDSQLKERRPDENLKKGSSQINQSINQAQLEIGTSLFSSFSAFLDSFSRLSSSSLFIFRLALYKVKGLVIFSATHFRSPSPSAAQFREFRVNKTVALQGIGSHSLPQKYTVATIYRPCWSRRFLILTR
jgi:hypothetical protein